MSWVLLLVFINSAGGVAINTVEMPSEDACAAAIKTVDAGITYSQGNVRVFAGATCINREK